MGKCDINLKVSFDSTAETPRLRAISIAEIVQRYLAVELSAANVRVEVHGAALDYRDAWERDRDAAEAASRDGLN